MRGSFRLRLWPGGEAAGTSRGSVFTPVSLVTLEAAASSEAGSLCWESKRRHAAAELMLRANANESTWTVEVEPEQTGELQVLSCQVEPPLNP